MGREFFGVVGFDLGPLIQGKMRTVKLKSVYKWFGMVDEHIGNHGLGIFWCAQILP